MSAFHRFQRVRIVRIDHPDTPPGVVGSEAVITALGGTTPWGWSFPYFVVIDADPENEVGVYEHEIEPLRYLPSAEDFASLEGDLPRGPVRMPEGVGA
jgi:hypothetical protein